MTPRVHLGFGKMALGVLRATLDSAGLEEEAFGLHDALDIGPLHDIDADAEQRLAFWANIWGHADAIEELRARVSTSLCSSLTAE
jgi:hypothetical protein